MAADSVGYNSLRRQLEQEHLQIKIRINSTRTFLEIVVALPKGYASCFHSKSSVMPHNQNLLTRDGPKQMTKPAWQGI
jgi:hypothetical protein